MNSTVLDALLAAIPLPAIAIDKTQRIVAANIDALTLVGGQAVGMNYISKLRQPALLDTIEATLQDGVARKARYLSNDGARDTTFQVSCRVAYGVGADTADAVILVFEDMTLVEQAGQMRRDFVANVSHELRTPLTALIGFIETLRGPARDDPDATRRFLDIMQNEAGRMTRLVGDLMSLNRVESDERLRPSTLVSVTDALNATIRSLAPLADDADVRIDADLGELTPMMKGDADQLRQVFTNLIENAIKYGGSGGRVEIGLEIVRREPVLRAPGVRVRVQDFGPGIDPVHLPRLTERFYRADNHRSRALGGTGLGLAICKHIINRHRGRLRVTSQVGQGATFTVLLPIVPDQAIV